MKMRDLSSDLCEFFEARNATGKEAILAMGKVLMAIAQLDEIIEFAKQLKN